MDADSAVAVAFLIDDAGGLVTVLVKVPNSQPTGTSEPHAGVEVCLQDGAVAIVEHTITGQKAHQLARTCGTELPRAFERVGGLRGDELRMGGIGHIDGQPQLGCGAGQVFVEARERGNAVAEGLGGARRQPFLPVVLPQW